MPNKVVIQAGCFLVTDKKELALKQTKNKRYPVLLDCVEASPVMRQ